MQLSKQETILFLKSKGWVYKCNDIYTHPTLGDFDVNQPLEEALLSEANDYIISYYRVLFEKNREDIKVVRKEKKLLREYALAGLALRLSGHDINNYRSSIYYSVKNMPDDIKERAEFIALSKSIDYFCDQFDDFYKITPNNMKIRLSFLDMKEFLNSSMSRYQMNGVCFSEIFSSDKKIDVIQYRLYGVFLNLIKNARKFAKNVDIEYHEGSFYITDDGPGVDPNIEKNMFNIGVSTERDSFTSGNKGLGLYICKKNLEMSGHDILYHRNKPSCVQSIHNGACFEIKLKDVK
jgi:signal transduction histidine kinase